MKIKPWWDFAKQKWICLQYNFTEKNGANFC
jgi:hypothetical protein